jgi:hypothetical protein
METQSPTEGYKDGKALVNMEKTCRNNCLYFSFTDDAGHYGSNWFCKAHGKQIKNADGFCDKHIDRYKKDHELLQRQR